MYTVLIDKKIFIKKVIKLLENSIFNNGKYQRNKVQKDCKSYVHLIAEVYSENNQVNLLKVLEHPLISWNELYILFNKEPIKTKNFYALSNYINKMTGISKQYYNVRRDKGAKVAHSEFHSASLIAFTEIKDLSFEEEFFKYLLNVYNEEKMTELQKLIKDEELNVYNLTENDYNLMLLSVS